MELRTINDLDELRGRRVLLRLDVNVPMARGRVLDDAKVRLALPTIAALRASGARVICCSHLGEGGPSQTLAPVAACLQRLLRGGRVAFLRDRIGSDALARRIARLRPGGVVLIENLRWYPGEVGNHRAFAVALAGLADVFLNDAFAVCHRAHASVVRLPALLPSAAGLLLAREVAALSALLNNPRTPFVALMGGAKVATKAPVIERFLGVADAILLGGALATTFLRARGFGVGASLVEPSGIRIAGKILRRSSHRNLMLPIDVVVGDASGRHRAARVVPVVARKPGALCGEREAILDIGPETIHAYSQQLRSAATIVWNGPVGAFERPPFHHGTVALARVIAARSSGRAFGVVGGGETITALGLTGMARYVDHVSSGGGAMLAFLAGEELPGLAPLVRE